MRAETMTFDRLVETLGGVWVRESFSVGDTEVPAAVMTGDHPRTGVAIEAVRGADRRFATCFADRSTGGGERCRRALTELVVEGRLWNVAFADNELRIDGQALTIPEGCVRVGGDRIRCPDAELHWRAPNPDCHMTADQARKRFEQTLRDVGDLTHATHDCRVLGEKLACEYYDFTAPNQTPVTIVASIRGCSRAMVQCNLFKPPGPQFPEPCSQVLSNNP